MVLRAQELRRAVAVGVAVAAMVFAWSPATGYDRYSIYDDCRGDAYWDGVCRGYYGRCSYPEDCYLGPPSPPKHRWRTESSEERRAVPESRRGARRTPPTPERRPSRDREEPARERTDAKSETSDHESGAATGSADEGGATARRKAAADGKIPSRFREMRNPVGHTVSAIARGAELYQTHCAACHGVQGAGDGPKAQRSSPRMPDLQHKVAQADATDAYLIWKILQGDATVGTGKHAFQDTLSERQAWRIVAYLRAGLPRADTRRTAGATMPAERSEQDGGEER